MAQGSPDSDRGVTSLAMTSVLRYSSTVFLRDTCHLLLLPVMFKDGETVLYTHMRTHTYIYIYIYIYIYLFIYLFIYLYI